MDPTTVLCVGLGLGSLHVSGACTLPFVPLYTGFNVVVKYTIMFVGSPPPRLRPWVRRAPVTMGTKGLGIADSFKCHGPNGHPRGGSMIKEGETEKHYVWCPLGSPSLYRNYLVVLELAQYVACAHTSKASTLFYNMDFL